MKDLAPEAVRNRTLPLGLMAPCGSEGYETEGWRCHLPERDTCQPLPDADGPGGPMDDAGETRP